MDAMTAKYLGTQGCMSFVVTVPRAPPFPPAVASTLLLSALTAAIE